MMPRCTQPPARAASEAAARYRQALPVLETARLVLRAPTLEDLPHWTRIYADWPTGGIGPERAWEEFSYYTAGWLLHGHGLWSVTSKDGTLLGFVLIGLEWGDPEPELGYMFVPEARGHGFATEAVTAARVHGLSLLDTMVSYVDPGNGPSNRLAVRIGAIRDRAAEAKLGQPIHVWRHGGDA